MKLILQKTPQAAVNFTVSANRTKKHLTILLLIWAFVVPIGILSAETQHYIGNEGYLEIYTDYMRWGKKALRENDYGRALDLFQYASLVNPTSEEPLFYINLIKRLKEKKVQRKASVPEFVAEKVAPAPLVKKEPQPSQRRKNRQQAIKEALDEYETLGLGSEIIPEIQFKSQEGHARESGHPASSPLDSRASGNDNKPLTKRFTQIKASDVLKGGSELYLNDELRATQPSSLVRIELNSSLMVKGRNIDRHLVITPGIIEIEKVDRDQVSIKAIKRGTTILHIWDDVGRWTFNVEVILPLITAEQVVEEEKPATYADPFKVSYSADWNSFYLGQSLSDVHRENLNFLHRYAIYGETPYGGVDAFGVSNKFKESTEIISYGAGLTNGDIGPYENFNIRGWDTSKEFSPLTLPGQNFRGILFESKAFNQMIDYKYIRGKDRATYGYLPTGVQELKESFIEGGQVTLNPWGEDKASLNYARGYGDARDPFLNNQVYSVEAQKRAGEVLFAGEAARSGEDDDARTLSGTFEQNNLKARVNLRDIDKEYTTVTNLPSNQGEIGGTALIDWHMDPIDVSSFLDVYQERLFIDPANGDQLNFDFSTTTAMPLSQTAQWRNSFFYLNTPGELSPRENMRAFTSLGKRFPFAPSKEVSTTIGGGYQKSRFKYSPISEYDRYTLNAGLRFPLVLELSYFANYEYSWVDELATGGRLMPTVFTTGLNYSHTFNKRLSGNLGYSYRDEENTEGINSFLAGEDSTTATAGLNFTPREDLEIFLDSRLRNVWKEQESSTAYNEVDVRVGMRSLWDLPFAWNPSGTIAGYVYKDLNNNKVKDPGESGIKDVRIRIGEQEAYTDTAGHYEVNVRAKKVYVSVDSSSVPQGFIFSTPTIAQIDVKKDVDKETNFGLTTESGVYGIVYYDVNQNGKPDADDEFIPRVKIKLDGKKETITDFEGTYLFQDIGEGAHEISLDVNSLPPEYLPTVKVKNSIHISEGVTYVFHIPVKLHK